MARVSSGTARARSYDLCVVGAGPAGCALADAAIRAGLSVIVVERGGTVPEAPPPILEIPDGVPHDADDRTMRQGLGGTFATWGGRCMPFDAVDFEAGPGAGWPFDHAEYARWIAPAAAIMGVAPVFARPVPADWPTAPDLRLDLVERLADRAIPDAMRARLADDRAGPDLLLGRAAVALSWSGRRVDGVVLDAADDADGGPTRISAARVVLACGGLQTTRLLLEEARRAPGRLTGTGWLGRGYMGHLTGSVGTIGFGDPAVLAQFGYRRSGEGDAERRRLTILPRDRASVAFWVENGPRADPAHRSGELSLKALATGDARPLTAHLGNIARDPIGVASGLASVLRTRARAGARHPDRLVTRGAGARRLCYHAEHLCDPDSHVALSARLAPDGRPALDVRFAYGERTIADVAAAHRRLAQSVARDGFATVGLPRSDAALRRAIRAGARDGYHQIGLTRMAASPADGVVDADARVHGTDNLYVASAAVFPRASQANPTLSIVALALRLADHLATSVHRRGAA